MERMWRNPMLIVVLLLTALLGCSTLAWSADNEVLDRIEGNVTRFTLENDLTFLVIEREQAPVASFVTMVGVGSVDEPAGRSGLAHMLEHMAFKGTSRIGTTNWEEEKKILAKGEEAYRQWQKARRSKSVDAEKTAQLKDRFQKLQKEAQKYVRPNEFASIIEANGGTDLNAATSSEYTMYFCSLPSNRAELWFSLESERLRDPVWREFFTEKEVVLEERRMRVDSSPIGQLMERLLAVSFLAHPYRQPVIGWESDIKAALPSDLSNLYEKYYVPGNMVCAVAGDVDPEQIKAWAEKYFGPLSKGTKPRPVETREPDQLGTRQVEISSRAQPVLARAYPGLSRFDPQAPALTLASDILSQGRTSRLYTSLVEDQELAAQVGTYSGYPADIDPGLFVVLAIPNTQVPLSDLAQGIDDQFDLLRNTEVSEQELQRVKTQARAQLLRGLDSNLGLARTLAQAQLLEGDWKEAFFQLNELEEVGPKDIQKAAQDILMPEKMTEARLIHAGGQPKATNATEKK
ncbi:MAG: M16 family metallopeptidase [Desulfovermiculus sp.]